MKHRSEIINYFAQKINAKSYLELGLCNPDEVFNRINCQIKHSVDINDEVATYTMSTDEFFERLKTSNLDLDKNFKWDLIFIDANHLSNFVKNDLLNSYKHLNDEGFIFLHDVLPQTYELQSEYGGCQTAWKVVPYVLKNHPELHICTISEYSNGLGIVFKNKDFTREVLDKNYNVFYEYYIMEKDKKTSQNYIEHEFLDEWINNPTYTFNGEIIKHKENMFEEYFKFY